MTTAEFSNEFDVLYNNIASNAAPGINEYEKSVFLTKAQSEIVKAYFNASANKTRVGFDASERRQYDFSILLRTASLFNVNSVKERVTTLEKIDKRSQVFLFPEDYFLSVNEIAADSNQFYSVLPITYTEYQRMMTKPFPYPPKRMAWRIISDKKNCNFIHKYFDDENKVDVKLLSSWADQKRKLKLSFNIQQGDVPTSSTINFQQNAVIFDYSKDNIDFDGYVKVDVTGSGWDESKEFYLCNFTITANADIDKIDYEACFDIIKTAFSECAKTLAKDHKLMKVRAKTDGFLNCEAPAKIAVENETVLEGKVISLPIAELIGKFNGDLTYQIRYVRRPKPIILEDLESDVLTIEGESKVTECELPSELHPEILQRAVELAKASATGDLSSMVGIGNASSTDIGVVPSNNASK